MSENHTRTNQSEKRYILNNGKINWENLKLNIGGETVQKKKTATFTTNQDYPGVRDHEERKYPINENPSWCSIQVKEFQAINKQKRSKLDIVKHIYWKYYPIQNWLCDMDLIDPWWYPRRMTIIKLEWSSSNQRTL